MHAYVYMRMYACVCMHACVCVLVHARVAHTHMSTRFRCSFSLCCDRSIDRPVVHACCLLACLRFLCSAGNVTLPSQQLRSNTSYYLPSLELAVASQEIAETFLSCVFLCSQVGMHAYAGR